MIPKDLMRNPAIRKQFIPSEKENKKAKNESFDIVDDGGHSPIKGLIKKYPTKIVILLTNKCFGYCRFCYRKDTVKDKEPFCLNKKEISAIVSYLKKNPKIKEVIITGGDPLTLSNPKLEQILNQLKNIGSIKILRIASRAHFFCPARFDKGLISILKKFKPFLMLHINHPDELYPKSLDKMRRLTDNGIIILSQTALLKGVNDNEKTLGDLFTKCVENRIIPYRLYHCDYVPGNSHFRTNVSKGVELLRKLQNRISGIAMPIYEIDLPGGKGKLPLNYNYIKKFDGKKFVFETWDGKEMKYFN